MNDEKKEQMETVPVSGESTPGQGLKGFCPRVRRRKSLYQEKALTGMGKELVETHLERCDACREFYEN